MKSRYPRSTRHIDGFVSTCCRNSNQSGIIILVTSQRKKHRIKILKSDTEPVQTVSYQAGPKMRKSKKAEIEKMLAENIIEPEPTIWTAPVVFLLKNNEIFQFCVNYRKPKKSYPLAGMDKRIESLGKATAF